jgi:hypothetical protein
LYFERQHKVVIEEAVVEVIVVVVFVGVVELAVSNFRIKELLSSSRKSTTN